ncbi:putative Magnesium transporter MRS2-7 [Cocos nucifera]|uniref:Magnesium transporter n=1 Tax=Cocos nucifera TaxID=13894 RepID=A0A8K0IVZ3_COCNU|nr:putative Magnesium transporter MRS2-7 [Cocos nucifera]
MAPEGWAAASEAHGVSSASASSSSSSARCWILLDFTGEEKVLDVDKYAVMQRVQIHARDLRIIDPLLSYPSSIMARERAIVLNLEHIKAIITAEEVLIRDPSNKNVIPLVEELRRRLPTANVVQQAQGEGSGHNEIEASEEDRESPFEFRALEVALEAICSFLDARTTDLETAAYPALDELTSKISSCNLDRVRKLKSAMTRLTARVQKVRDELEQLLDDDNDMADLYLSRKMAGASSPNGNPGVPDCLPASQTTGSNMLRASRASSVTFHGNENDVEELEMLLERTYWVMISRDSMRCQIFLLIAAPHWRQDKSVGLRSLVVGSQQNSISRGHGLLYWFIFALSFHKYF